MPLHISTIKTTSFLAASMAPKGHIEVQAVTKVGPICVTAVCSLKAGTKWRCTAHSLLFPHSFYECMTTSAQPVLPQWIIPAGPIQKITLVTSQSGVINAFKLRLPSFKLHVNIWQRCNLGVCHNPRNNLELIFFLHVRDKWLDAHLHINTAGFIERHTVVRRLLICCALPGKTRGLRER